jgi:hypothetical protein
MLMHLKQSSTSGLRPEDEVRMTWLPNRRWQVPHVGMESKRMETEV